MTFIFIITIAGSDESIPCNYFAQDVEDNLDLYYS